MRQSDIPACAGILCSVYNNDLWQCRWERSAAIEYLTDLSDAPKFLGYPGTIQIEGGSSMILYCNVLTPELFLELYQSVGWEAPDLDQITTALEHSYATFCAYDGERAIGMARLLGDGGMSFYIKDFAVRPEYQGKGVGRLLMTAIEEYIMSHIPNGWAVSLELISSKGREPFYERFGFEQRPCDWDGAGMFKMIRK